MLRHSGDVAAAVQLLDEQIEAATAAHGPTHPTTVAIHAIASRALHFKPTLELAEAHAQFVYDQRVAQLGIADPQTQAAFRQLWLCLRIRKAGERAIAFTKDHLDALLELGDAPAEAIRETERKLSDLVARQETANGQ